MRATTCKSATFKNVILLNVCLLCSSLLIAQNKSTEIYPADFNSKPTLAWKFKTNAPIYSSPVKDDNNILFGSCDSNLYCINISSGKLKWKYKTNGEIRSTVAINGTQAFTTSGDGFLYAFNKNTGKVLWTFKTGGERQYELFGFADYYQSSPIVNDGAVFFGSGDGSIYSVDAITGKELWKFKTGSVVHATPVVDSNRLFVGSFDGYFYALDKNNGALLWKFKSVGQKYFPKGEMQGDPAVFNGLVFTGSRDYNLYAIDEQGGYCHWNRKFPKGWAMGKPSVRDSILYVGTSDDFEMHAIDPATGSTLWKTNAKFNIFGGMAFSESMGYFGTLMGKLFAIDLKIGQIQWSFETDAYHRNRSTYFDDNDVYLKGLFGTVIKKNEDFLTLYEKMGAIFSTLAITTDRIVFTSLDGNVYCLKR